jgi:hypothetical protein
MLSCAKRVIEVDYNFFYFFNKSCLSGFELKNSISDTMLNYYILINLPKKLNRSEKLDK